ncbi:MAG: hypothetical protein J0M07_11855 [Anaerolineae bacterium]|nr:hypothetical protein [Anaerolineae bacterium]
MEHNYYNTFIEVAEDCPVPAAEVPARKGDKPTIAVIHFELISEHPYEYTQEDILFETYARTHDISDDQRAAEREQFFAKGQPCLRTSPLCKRYGWGFHHDEEGRVALYPRGSAAYEQFASTDTLKHLKGMRSKRA